MAQCHRQFLKRLFPSLCSQLNSFPISAEAVFSISKLVHFSAKLKSKEREREPRRRSLTLIGITHGGYYPVGVSEHGDRPAKPSPATAAAGISVPSSTAHTVPFPTDEILAMDLSKPKPDPENLRVFLRIRPLFLAKMSQMQKCLAAKEGRAAREQKTKKKRNPNPAEVCVKVNSTRSVIVSPPLALQEPNRLKSEVYDDFSGVFSADSSQAEVYEMMVKPLVDDFLKGKSGMLAAMGPSGSGKTHTVFGSPREPGMVPLALQQIFKKVPGSNTEPPRRDLPASSLSPKNVNSAVKNETEKPHESSNLPTSPKDVSAKKRINNVANGEPRGPKSEKPKWRLLPASSALLRNIGALDIEDENEKPKGGDTTRTRTQGSISLMRLLQSNLRS